MLKAKTDFSCILKDEEGNALLEFKASAGSDLINNSSFVGGGVASAGQSLTVFTEAQYPFKAFAHYVYIDGTKYTIQSVGTSYRRKLGAVGGIRKVYVLELA